MKSHAADDRLVFLMPRAVRLVMPVFPLWLFGGSDLFRAWLTSSGDEGSQLRIRWPIVAALLIVVAAIFWWFSACRTFVTRDGISVRQIGRPCRWPRRTFIPWTDVAVIDAFHGGYGNVPVVHLKEGGAILARLPTGHPRPFTESIARIQQRHLQATGLTPEQIPAAPAIPAPGWRRRVLVVGLLAAVIAADVMLVIAGFSRYLHSPPDVAACPLVPADLAQRIVPGAVPEPRNFTGAPSGPAGLCAWNSPEYKKKQALARMNVGVTSYTHGHIADSFEDVRRRDRISHIVHSMSRGYSWAAFNDGTVTAEAHARVGDRTLRVSLYSIGYGLTTTEAERLARQVATVAAARLEEAPS